MPIIANTGGFQGGGVLLYATDSIISDNAILSNTGRINDYSCGGGLTVYAGSNATLSRNRIVGNTAFFGGGFCMEGSKVVLSSNVISGNTATNEGGGLALWGSNATLDGNRITANAAAHNAGGILLCRVTTTLSNDAILDNRADWSGSGLYIQGSPSRLLHSTIAGNSGGSGVYITRDPIASRDITVTLINTILTSHTVGISITGTNELSLNTVLWFNTPVTVSQSVSAVVQVKNQYVGDPAFIPDGYHLRPGSAAIDRGIDAGVTTDIDGDPRPLGNGYDIGADESTVIPPPTPFRSYLPLLLRAFTGHW